MKKQLLITALLLAAFLISIVATPYASVQTASGASIVNPNESYGDLSQYDWPLPVSGDSHSTSFSEGPAPDRPNVLWQSDKSAPAMGSQYGGYNVIFGGKVFVRSRVSNVGYLNALNAETGQLIWSTPETVLGNYATRFSTGTFSSQAPFWGGDDNHVFVWTDGPTGIAQFNANNGQFLWWDNITCSAAYHRILISQETKMLFGPWYPPNGTYGVNGPPSYQYVISAFDMSNPDQPFPEVWRTLYPEQGNPLPCYGDGKIFVGCYSSAEVACIDATNGDILWRTAVPDYLGYRAVYANGLFIAGCTSQHIFGFNATTGEIEWHNDDGVANRAFNVWNGAYGYGRTYWHDLGAGVSGATKCLDAATGEELWRYPTYEYIGYYQIVLGDGKLYGMQSDGSTTTGRESTPRRFACWDAFTGALLWYIDGIEFAQPAIAYGKLYISGGGITYCISTLEQPKDWPMWRGSVETPQVTSEFGPRNLSPGPYWTFKTAGGVSSSPVVVDGKLYIGGEDGYIYCLDAYTGAKVWSTLLGGPGIQMYSTPAVYGGKVIIGPDNGNIYALDADTGTQIWQVPAGGFIPFKYESGQWQPRSSPIIYNNRIYVGSLDGLLRCLDMDGNVIWSYDVGDPICGSVAIADNYIYLESTSLSLTGQTNDGKCFKFDLSGHKVLDFTFPTKTRAQSQFDSPLRPAATPVVVGDKIFLGIFTSSIMCYSATTGEELFRASQPNVLAERAPVSPLYVPDTLLTAFNQTTGRSFGNTGGKIIVPAGPTTACLRADNGSNLWTAWGGWEVFSSPLFTGFGQGTMSVYGGSQSYSITCWNATNGAPLSWFTTSGQVESSPCVYDGRLYFGSLDGNVYCFYDDPTETTSISMSLSSTEIGVNQPVTVTANLVVPLKDFDDNVIHNPGLPQATVLFTFTRPDGSEIEQSSTTDNFGTASTTYTPNVAGDWKVIAWYNGQQLPAVKYTYAFSDETVVKVGGSNPTSPPPATTAPPTTAPTTAPPVTSSPTETASTDNTMTYVYVAIAVIVIVVIIAAALMLMRRKK